MGEEAPKSAYEIAMEKLRARDREQGIEDVKVLSEEQKRRISEVRGKARAKLAEMEIMRTSDRAGLAHDREALEKAEREYAAERLRVEERAEAQIDKIRRGE